MKSSRINQLTEDQLADLIVLFAVVIGLLLRVAFPLIASFPLNDGGLFYGMIRDLQANGYALPAYTSYNHAQIPFAYPPLAFYIAGLLTDLTRLDLLVILRLLPPLVSAAAIPVYYLLAKQFLSAKSSAALAALLFAFAGRIFGWQIMGGGITRSFGFLFALLTIYCASRLFSSRSARFVFWTSIWAALTILTHPEAIPQTALAVLIIYLFMDRSRKALMLSLSAAALILLFTSAWWITVLGRHALNPFIAIWAAASANSNPLLARPIALFQFLMTEEPFLPFLAFLGLVGTFKCLADRKYFLPVWMALPYLFEPRSGPLYMMIPLLLLAVQGLTDVIAPSLSPDFKESRQLSVLLRRSIARTFLIFLLVYLLVAGYFTAAKIYNRATLTKSQQETMDWVRESTLAEARFLVISGGQPFLDPASDWFPALTGRVSVATVFGYEWINDRQFAQRIERYETLQTCLGQTAACLEAWSQETGIEFDHVYMQDDVEFPALKMDLLNSEAYVLLHEQEGVSVFQRTRGE